MPELSALYETVQKDPMTSGVFGAGAGTAGFGAVGGAMAVHHQDSMDLS